ncbi:MAG: flagellar hook-associated protein FlgK [Dongiaceae bacterium]
MSLTIALHNALTGLQTNQAALQVTSNNIANANTAGYTRKIVDQQHVVLDGQGAGVDLTAIRRHVDEFLVTELRASTSSLAGMQVQDSILQRVQNMFGSPSSDTSIGAAISRFATDLAALAASPETASLRLTVVAAGEALAQQLNAMSLEVQQLRFEADQKIATAAAIVNDQLSAIDELNGQISRGKANNQPTADLEDQRDIALGKLAEQIDIRTFTRDNGEVVVFTGSGRVLLDQTFQPLSHAPVSSMTAGFAYPGVVTGIMSGGVDITGDLLSGRIGALVDLRDDTLPELTAEISRLAQTLRDEVNRVHNEGSGRPAPTTLTGSRAQTGTATLLAGTVRITLVNADGTQAFTGVVAAPGTLDAAGFATQINTVLAGFGVGASANAVGGVVTINGGGTYGVVLSGGTITPGGGAPVTNLSDFLHLNDFFVGDDPAGADHAAVIAVRSDIVSSPHRVSRGQLRLDPVTGTYYLSAGDNTVIQSLATKFNEQLVFAAAGKLPQTGATLADYGATILALVSSDYATLSDQMARKQALFDELDFRSRSISGVNMDEELANMVVLQNAYAASARIITTAAEMFDVLTAMGR